jgi:hypothetical protein
MICVLFLVAACFCVGALGAAYQYAIATFPGEPFSKFQLDRKQEKGPCTVPFFFGYTWNGGKWPTYVPDVRSAALGSYGDWGPVRAPEEGEKVMTRHLNNYYVIKGLMRKTQGPGDHRLDDGTVIWMPDWQKKSCCSLKVKNHDISFQ